VDSTAVAIWDTKTLAMIKTIGMDGGPDWRRQDHHHPADRPRHGRSGIQPQYDGGVQFARRLTIVKENSPASFAVEQTVQTMRGAQTLTPRSTPRLPRRKQREDAARWCRIRFLF